MKEKGIVIVTAGSYDILHRGHRDVLKQVWNLAQAFGNSFFHTLVWSVNPSKVYLLTPKERVYIIKNFYISEGIKSNIHIFPVLYEEHDPEADKYFKELIGLSRYDSNLLFITGIKEEDVKSFQVKLNKFHRNSGIESAKIVFVVSGWVNPIFNSSSKIKEFLYKHAFSHKAYLEAIEFLLKEDIIDTYTANILINCRIRLLNMREFKNKRSL
ncbi:hypothetical protein [Dictyoglomus thermophilum]|uniref:Cytidyltransferase-like domain-containing protein n=1 Tax=Dictyoglomus thermophilum (strain ATCC 35947 / DSM 3960 / H-6-12) TaxID=309799 RepID=B5YBY6_DICT6|nr:hypothetical protein [Dictyoglomus thermophilum]ACI19691.1 hypothetical protein DICTH_0211 [Dictyoglomus thermophilum H-6-12]